MVVSIALLCCAVVALRGHLPGAEAARPPEPGAPSALTLALMPVLLTVSVVILTAGVIASRHRLPLAVPEPERDEERELGKLGPIGVLAVAGLALLAMALAVGSVAYLLRATAPEEEPGPVVLPPSPTGTAPLTTDAPPPDPGAAPLGLDGTALLLTAVTAAVLLGAALIGLIVVLFSGPQARRRAVAVPPEPEPPSTIDSLARAAEMGLAAMNAPGQDARTAIIACYVAMERGLSADRAAAPLASDTPMEVLARAFEHGALRDASARELVAMFEEARFSPHSMLEWQRMRAEQLLRVVLADLQGEMA
ncbi:DUF4129 domain-containing protein [Nocardia jiangsuensis]|uniref:DUF4129 domain-containing protein n=1 Tax=Nocardia jiangsuensis TaxID=1691563 RepID=A0ABV8DWT8_9NOCA